MMPLLAAKAATTKILWLLLSFACFFQVAQNYLVRRFRRLEVDAPARSHPTYSVSHLKTIHGKQDRTPTNLLSYIRQDYQGPTEVVFTAGRLNDPCLEIVRGFQEVDPTIKVIEGHAAENCTNPKVASMIQGYPHCTADFVLSTDSDMHAPLGYMNKMMQEFDDPQVGMSTCLYCIQRVHRPAMALEALSVLDFSTSVLVARAIEGMSFGLGANMAFRREALEQIGAFKAVGEYLAEDYQLGNRIHKAGWKVKLAGVFVEDVLPDMTFMDYFKHQLRWMRTYRISRPFGHFSYVVTQGTAWVTLLLLLNGWCLSTALAMLLWNGIRVGCTASNWKNLGGQQVDRWVGWLPFKDLVYLVLWLMSLVGDTVKWGPRHFKLSRDGTMKLVRMEK